MKKITGLFGLLAFLVSFGAMAAQNPIVIPNTGTLSGLSLVNLTNDAFATLNTGWSGSSAPSTPATGQTWLDTSAVGIIAVKRYALQLVERHTPDLRQYRREVNATLCCCGGAWLAHDLDGLGC